MDPQHQSLIDAPNEALGKAHEERQKQKKTILERTELAQQAFEEAIEWLS